MSMADSIQNRKNQQSYMRQIQQEKMSRKRDIVKNQNEDIKSVRDYYKDQTKQVDTETVAAVNHIKEEARMLAQQEKQERAEKSEALAEQRRLQREEAKASSYTSARPASEKKNTRT